MLCGRSRRVSRRGEHLADPSGVPDSQGARRDIDVHDCARGDLGTRSSTLSRNDGCVRANKHPLVKNCTSVIAA